MLGASITITITTTIAITITSIINYGFYIAYCSRAGMRGEV